MIHILDKQTDIIIGIYDNDLTPKWFENDHHKDSIDNYETFDFTANGRIPEAEFLSGQNRLIIEGDRPKEWREFVIWSTFKADGVVEVKSNGSYIEMNKDKMVEPKTLLGVTPEQAVADACVGTEWQVGEIDYAGAKNVTLIDYMGAYEMLLIIARDFDMELHFRVEIQGNKVVGRYVDLLVAVGMNNGKEILFGKDLVGIEREEVSEIYTALIVQGPEREDGTKLTVTVENDEARQRWGRGGRHLWGYHQVESDNREMLAAELTTYGLKQLNKKLEGVVSYKATAIGLEHVLGLAHEKVLKGDWVRIKDESYAPPLYMDARVVEVDRQPSDRAAKTFVLGEIIQYTEEEVMATFKKLKAELDKKVGRDELIEIVEGQVIVKSAIAPENPTLNMLWLDTSRVPNVLSRWDGTQWVKGTPTVPGDIGAETPQEIQDRIDILRDAVAEDVGEVSQALTDFEAEIGTTFRDGIIDEAEAKSIETYKNTLNTEKADVDSRYTTVYGNAFLLGTPKTNLANAKTAYNTGHTNLINSIDAAIADSKTTPAEKADVDAKFATYRGLLATLAQRFDQALDEIAKAQSESVSGKNTAIMRLQIELGTISDTTREMGVVVTELNANTHLQANPILDTLNNAQIAFNAKGDQLYTEIQNAIADEAISQTEQQNIDAFRVQYRQTLDALIKQIKLAEDEAVRVSANTVVEYADRLISKGPNFPTDPQELDLWVDTFDFPPVWRQYVNGNWTNVTRTNMSDMQGKIVSTQIGPDSVQTGHMAANAVTAKHIAANTIVSNMISTAGLDAGVITFGTMTGITADVTQAGMTAQGTAGSAIRFWAGAVYNSRAIAPFRVTQDGAVYASNMTITGGSLTGVDAQFGGSDNQYGVVAVYDADGELTAELNGQFGGFANLNVGYLVAPNKVEYGDFRDVPLNLYVAVREQTSSYIIGPPNDSNDGLSDAFPLRTIAEALRRIPKNFDGNVNIILANNGGSFDQAFNEKVELSGFSGDGILTIHSNSLNRHAQIDGVVRSVGNTVKTNFVDIDINAGASYAGMVFQQSYGIVDDCKINGIAGGGTTMGVAALNNANVEVYRTDFANVDVCMRASYGGLINAIDCTGRGRIYAYQGWEGGYISGGSESPVGDTANGHEYRGGLVRGTWTFPTPAPTPAPTPVTTTKSWSSRTDSGTWRADEGRWDIYGAYTDNVTQGTWAGYGPFTGSWFFGTDVAASVTGKTIKSMRILVTRISGGVYASQTMVMRPHTSATRPSGNVSPQSVTINSNIAVGESKWITLPTSFHSGFQSGSYKGITINGGNYVKMSRTAKLEITYI